VSLDCHARLYAGHPRLCSLATLKTWMAGTSPAMTFEMLCLALINRTDERFLLSDKKSCRIFASPRSRILLFRFGPSGSRVRPSRRALPSLRSGYVERRPNRNAFHSIVRKVENGARPRCFAMQGKSP
jgi:hypothetical protein